MKDGEQPHVLCVDDRLTVDVRGTHQCPPQCRVVYALERNGPEPCTSVGGSAKESVSLLRNAMPARGSIDPTKAPTTSPTPWPSADNSMTTEAARPALAMNVNGSSSSCRFRIT